MSRPLNPDLFEKLARAFGPVEIRNAGEAMRGRYINGLNGRQFIMDSPGEYYAICCPFCNDTRHRCWIHYRWGVRDEHGNSRWWSAHCYNEDCLSEQAYRKDLISRVYHGLGRDGRRRVRIRPGVVVSTVQQIVLPGHCPPVDQLPVHHPAVTYLRRRNLDPQSLANTYDVRFCQQTESQFAVAQGRLVIPVHMRGNLVGWQARYLGEADWRCMPKYYSCPGMKKAQCLYNFDLARQSPVAIICEGATDAWAVGNAAVALFGKSASVYQRDLIAATWRQGAAVVLLDQDAGSEADRLTSELKRRLAGGAVHVELPEGNDPASLDRDVLWDWIWAACTRANVDLIALLRK